MTPRVRDIDVIVLERKKIDGIQIEEQKGKIERKRLVVKKKNEKNKNKKQKPEQRYWRTVIRDYQRLRRRDNCCTRNRGPLLTEM